MVNRTTARHGSCGEDVEKFGLSCDTEGSDGGHCKWRGEGKVLWSGVAPMPYTRDTTPASCTGLRVSFPVEHMTWTHASCQSPWHAHHAAHTSTHHTYCVMHVHAILTERIRALSGDGQASSRMNAALQLGFAYAPSLYDLASITSSSLLHGHQMLEGANITQPNHLPVSLGSIPNALCLWACAQPKT